MFSLTIDKLRELDKYLIEFPHIVYKATDFMFLLMVDKLHELGNYLRGLNFQGFYDLNYANLLVPAIFLLLISLPLTKSSNKGQYQSQNDTPKRKSPGKSAEKSRYNQLMEGYLATSERVPKQEFVKYNKYNGDLCGQSANTDIGLPLYELPKKAEAEINIQKYEESRTHGYQQQNLISPEMTFALCLGLFTYHAIEITAMGINNETSNEIFNFVFVAALFALTFFFLMDSPDMTIAEPGKEFNENKEYDYEQNIILGEEVMINSMEKMENKSASNLGDSLLMGELELAMEATEEQGQPETSLLEINVMQIFTQGIEVGC